MLFFLSFHRLILLLDPSKYPHSLSKSYVLGSLNSMNRGDLIHTHCSNSSAFCSDDTQSVSRLTFPWSNRPVLPVSSWISLPECLLDVPMLQIEFSLQNLYFPFPHYPSRCKEVAKTSSSPSLSTANSMSMAYAFPLHT